MKETIYLIGSISVDKPETYEWRQYVREYFKHDSYFEIIDPCDNEWNTGVLKKATDDPHRLKIYKERGVSLIVPKDKTYVRKSTMAIADLNQYDPDKPLIGTLFELAWYHDEPEKTVIGIYDGDPMESVWCGHPFVQDTVRVWVRTHQEACELVEMYFRRDV